MNNCAMMERKVFRINCKILKSFGYCPYEQDSITL